MAKTRLGRFILRIYRGLLRLYPGTHHEIYAEEMEEVFDRVVEDKEMEGKKPLLRLLWHELRDLPRLLAGAYTRLRPVGMGMLFFIVLSFFLALMEIPREWKLGDWLTQSEAGNLMWIWILFPYIGMCIGWIKGFPRWAYPYVGYSLLFSLYMTQVATPGLKFASYVFSSHEVWGARAWIPFGLAALVALLVTRSLRPVAKFFVNLWQDWTILSYTLFGFMPLLIMIMFDEMGHLFSFISMIILGVVMLVTATLYLTAQTQRQRVLAMLVGIPVTVALTVLGPIIYWLPLDGVNVPMSVMYGLIAMALFLSPSLLGGLRRIMRRPNPTA